MTTTQQPRLHVRSAELPPAAELSAMYLTMKTTTLVDERISDEVRTGELNATFYPVRGLEAVCAALGAALRPTDYLVSTYRNLGDAVAKGVPLRSIIAEAYGRITGTSKGKGGPMHLHHVDTGFMMTTGIVGSGVPVAAGLALAAQIDGGDRVTAVTFGDGATSIGAFHEAMNLAALWKLPIIFICQNNQWAEHTPLAEHAANPDLAARAGAYSMSARSVDGFDAIATWQVMTEAVSGVRAGGGPVFVECLTYRLAGHTGATAYSYMPADELSSALSRDPAPSFKRWLIEQGHLDEQAAVELDGRAQQSVDDAFSFAKTSAPPGLEEIQTDLFATSTGA